MSHWRSSPGSEWGGIQNIFIMYWYIIYIHDYTILYVWLYIYIYTYDYTYSYIYNITRSVMIWSPRFGDFLWRTTKKSSKLPLFEHWNSWLSGGFAASLVSKSIAKWVATRQQKWNSVRGTGDSNQPIFDVAQNFRLQGPAMAMFRSIPSC
jgi:hypothetical protein